MALEIKKTNKQSVSSHKLWQTVFVVKKISAQDELNPDTQNIKQQ